jgi:hypothetical protein
VVQSRNTFNAIFGRDLGERSRRPHYRKMLGDVVVAYLTTGDEVPGPAAQGVRMKANARGSAAHSAARRGAQVRRERSDTERLRRRNSLRRRSAGNPNAAKSVAAASAEPTPGGRHPDSSLTGAAADSASLPIVVGASASAAPASSGCATAIAVATICENVPMLDSPWPARNKRALSKLQRRWAAPRSCLQHGS